MGAREQMEPPRTESPPPAIGAKQNTVGPVELSPLQQVQWHTVNTSEGRYTNGFTIVYLFADKVEQPPNSEPT